MKRKTKEPESVRPWTAIDGSGNAKVIVLACSKEEARTSLQRRGIWHSEWKLRPATQRDEAELPVFKPLRKQASD